MKTLKELEYHMPAEWEPHAAVWLAWPHDEISFPGRIPKVESDVVKIISAIYHNELVELLVLDEGMKLKAADKLAAAGVDLNQVSFRIANYMDAWMRDCGGIFIKPSLGKLKLTNWIFNSWGNKFPDLLVDADIPKKVAEWTNTETVEPGIVLEGGAIDVNGKGLCLTTEQCLLNPNRNPGKTKADYEKILGEYLGVQKIIWLKQGLFNDHTDGHIDDIAKFVAPNKIVSAYEDNINDENYETLENNYQELAKATNADGQPFEVIKLPMPHLLYKEQAAGTHSNKVPASYTNFYIGNSVVLVPTYNDSSDEKALEIIQACFPDRKVVGIDSTDLIYGGGAIHCMTQQQPK